MFFNVFNWCFLGTEFWKNLNQLKIISIEKTLIASPTPHKKKHQRIELLGTDGLFLSRIPTQHDPAPSSFAANALGFAEFSKLGSALISSLTEGAASTISTVDGGKGTVPRQNLRRFRFRVPVNLH